ncbi:MAG TPA: hypothetical protein VKV40_16240 [Ktedonobacteraceae bacterium]|nr:hypothetical protein [Ktedonobacteraceae bacterium]
MLNPRHAPVHRHIRSLRRLAGAAFLEKEDESVQVGMALRKEWHDYSPSEQGLTLRNGGWQPEA